jgi:hypothetical protein
MERITWVEEDGAQFLRSSRGVLDYREPCRSGRAVVIVHRNIEVCTFQVGVRGIDPEALAIPPRNLQDIQEDRRRNGARWELTATSFRGVGAGAATTRSASRPRVSRAARPVGWNILLVWVFPMPPVSAYIRPTQQEREPRHGARGR